MNCRYCHAPLPEDSRESKQFCSASHKVMFSRKGAQPKAQLPKGAGFSYQPVVVEHTGYGPNAGKGPQVNWSDVTAAAKIQSTDAKSTVVTKSSTESKPMPAIPKKILKKPVIKSVSVEDEEDVIPAPKALKKVVAGIPTTRSKPKFTGPRQWPTDITLGEVKNRLKGIRNYLEWATEQGLRGQIATRTWVEGLLAQAGQPASLADLVFGPKQQEEEVDEIPG
jgi:hypothetical protein